MLQNFATARSFAPMPTADQATLLASVYDAAGDERHEYSSPMLYRLIAAPNSQRKSP